MSFGKPVFGLIPLSCAPALRAKANAHGRWSRRGLHATISLVAAWTIAFFAVILLLPPAGKVIMACLYTGVSFYVVSILVCLSI